MAEDEVVFFYASEFDSDEVENVQEARLLEALEQGDQADKKAAGYPLRKSESIFDSDVP